MKDTQQIKTKRFTVYYFGTAQGEYTSDRSDWYGTVKGDVLYVENVGENAFRKISGSKVTLTVSTDRSVNVEKGRSTTTLTNLPLTLD